MNQTTAIISQILQLVTAAAGLGPAFSVIVTSAKAMIDALFTAKLITVEQQNATKAMIDSIEAMVNAGIIPDHWQVEPDPE